MAKSIMEQFGKDEKEDVLGDGKRFCQVLKAKLPTVYGSSHYADFMTEMQNKGEPASAFWKRNIEAAEDAWMTIVIMIRTLLKL